MLEPVVYVVILNWNNWEHTIACLESVFQLDYANFRVVVCDNGSSNDSEARLRDWAAGKLPAPAVDPATLTAPATAKPLPLTFHARADAESGGMPDDHALVLVQTGANLGFAGGCNVGIRYALARGDAEYVWLLNNDTVVEKSALTALVRRACQDASIGLVGSTLLSLRPSNRVQALGGGVLRWTGTTRHIGYRATWPVAASTLRGVEDEMDYVVGASMLASRRMLDDIGLMSEDYFLYYEELDWAYRARERFRIAYAPESIVHHIEGGASGFSLNRYYYYRSMVRFAWRHRRLCLPCVLMYLVAKLGVAVVSGDRAARRLVLEVFRGRPVAVADRTPAARRTDAIR